MSKKKPKLNSLRLEGNNGGDYIEIHERDDGRIHLKVGHCCVVVIDHIVPVEFLTLILGGLMAHHREPLDLFVNLENYEVHGWDIDFMEELAGQIEPYSILEDLDREKKLEAIWNNVDEDCRVDRSTHGRLILTPLPGKEAQLVPLSTLTNKEINYLYQSIPEDKRGK